MTHIKKIYIDSFRGIKNLELDNLSMVNIITGDNNCGKTSVLEIIQSFSQPDDMSLWRSLIRKDLRISARSGMTLYEGFYDLFDINSEEKYISYAIECEENTNCLCLRGKIVEEEMPEEKYAEILGLILRRDGKEEQFVDNIQMVTKLDIEIYLNEERLIKDGIYEGQYYLNGPYRRREKRFSKNITYISPVRHAEGNLFLSQVLDNPDLYEEMLTILKEYDEDILSINYDIDNNNKLPSRGVYKILSKANQKALPLNVYGDGMKKAVLLMSAVVQAKNGILLLDEFETAIHTSAMNKTFKWILEACKKLNVQLFMTSHSKEAIDKVLKCSPELIDDIAVYTMYKNDDNVSVRRLDARKAIEVQDEMGLELR